MNFCWITLHVNNMKESLNFYHEVLGLPIHTRHGDGVNIEIVMLGEENKTKIELLYKPNDSKMPKVEGLSIGIEVKNLDEMITYLESKQIKVIKGPFSPTPHVRFCFVKDPNGIEVQLVETK